MLSPTTIWIAFALYMCFLLGVAVYVTVQDKKKAAGGSLLTASVKWPVLVMTYIASLMSTWVFFAGPGAYYRGGLGYWISEMSYIALFPIIAHFTMNKVWIINREMGGTFSTPADFYDARFKSRALRIILALIFLCASFPYIASVLVAIANAAQYATDGAINYRLAVIVVVRVCRRRQVCRHGRHGAGSPLHSPALGHRYRGAHRRLRRLAEQGGHEALG